MDGAPPIILVTGAASGIGAAVARRLAGPGVRMMLHARGKTLDALACELGAAGADVATMLCDLGEEDAGRMLVGRTLERFGGLHQLVSNAGFADPTPLGVIGRAVFDRSIAAMTGAFFDLTSAAMPALSACGHGRVVAISSFVAHRYAGEALFPATAAAKAGIEALARTLAVQLGPAGVTVNCVVPGYTRKDPSGHRAISEAAMAAQAQIVPTRRLGEPDDIAALVQFLLSMEARQITGQSIHVDGGLCLG